MAKVTFDFSDARAAYDRSHHDTALRLLKLHKKKIAKADPAVQAEYWEFVRLASVLISVKTSLEAARELLACEPDAAPAILAIRTAKLAVAESRVKRMLGYDTFQAALKLAPDDETRGQVLVQWGSGLVEHDRVTTSAALLDAYDLVKAGKLSKATASRVLECYAFEWPNARAKRAEKAQDALLAARNVDRWTLLRDCYARYIALNPEPSAMLARMITGLAVDCLDEGRDVPAAMKLYATWSPRFEAAYRGGHIDRETLATSWYDSWAYHFTWLHYPAEAESAKQAAAAVRAG